MQKNKKMKKNNDTLSPKLWKATKIALIILFISAVGLFLYFFQPDLFNFQAAEAPAPIISEEHVLEENICPDCVRRNLDGIMVLPEVANLRPFAVIIDNFQLARPQFGLAAASLVYEAPVEGGVTRYLAIFDPESAPAEIGPVRSARTYFLNWAKELGATFVHVGGSPDALEAAKKIAKSDLNEFYKGEYFWRSSKLVAPHNVLTSKEKLNTYRLDYKESGAEFKPWQFKEASTSSEEVIRSINLKYPNEYAVLWEYNKDNNLYERYLDNKAHLDASSEKITANNLIIHLASFKVIDDDLRLEMSSALSGQALLCQDGNCLLGKWQKDSPTSRTKYYYKSGEEFIFNAGKTWIEVIEDFKYLKY